LPLSYMLGLDFFFLSPMQHVFVVFLLLFLTTKKKGRGVKRCRFLFPYLAFQISYVFLPDVSVLDALIIIGFYITKSPCLISAKFPYCIYLIDSFFPRTMKMCTIQGSLKVHFFYL
jgi:hypothetical protein